MATYNTDSASDMEELAGICEAAGALAPGQYAGVRPREKLYGDIPGVDAIDDVPDVLLEPDQYEDALREAHEKQILPIYHMQDKWSPPDFRYDQNGLSYCWAWAGTAGVMTVRACENKPTVRLAPVSMGYLVGWKNKGNYLEDFVRGAQVDGICPAIDGNMNDTRNSASLWEQYKEQRKLHRLGRCVDTNKREMKKHCLSILCYGRPLYIAYNWWSHALMLGGIRIENGIWNWDIRNSHKDLILTLTGSKAIPDEAIGFISTELTE